MRWLILCAALCLPLFADEANKPSAARTHSQPGVVKQRPESGRYVEIPGGFMVPYQVQIPGTDQKIWMEPIPGGEFVMGSPESEPGRTAIEGPQTRWRTAPFWMSRCEITQGQFRPFMNLYSVFQSAEFRHFTAVDGDDFRTRHETVDAVTAPTQLYEPD